MIILKPERNGIYYYNIKKTKDYLINRHDILFKGYFKLSTDSNDLIVDKIYFEKDYKEVAVSDSFLIKIFKKQDIVLTKNNAFLEKFLSQYNIHFKVNRICDFCLLTDKITLLDDTQDYKVLDKHYCKKCAVKYVTFNTSISSKSLLENLLNKYDDLEYVIEHINDNPLDNDNLTLYDVIDANIEYGEKTSVTDLNIPCEFKSILTDDIEYLYPVQALAVDAGLLEGEDLLIVSSTASGKTLIGELGGIPKALNHKKMIYLSPLVALANQKYYYFKNNYEKLGLNVVLQVGSNRIKCDDELFVRNPDISSADIVVATYEGLDYILRSGRSDELFELGTVIIDEIQLLDDEDRGHRLNGLINRLKFVFPDAQLIALSATVNNCEDIADLFSMKLVKHDGRPVKIERHLVSYLNQKYKFDLITKLCRNEYDNVSTMGFHGQTIIFTDSRRKCEEISRLLNKNGVKSSFYHSGLSYSKRVSVENDFLSQDISTVVTTMALASGIDFPASMVIFETMRMGIDWIDSNDFHQMLGRAGRPRYHDLGKIYLFAYDGNVSYDNEYDVAKYLLGHDVNDITILFDSCDVYEEVLSDICAIKNVNINKLNNIYDNYLLPTTFNEALFKLEELGMIINNLSDNTYYPTDYGIATSKSFININTAEYIKENIYENPIKLIINIEQIHNAYLKTAPYKKKPKGQHLISNNLFSDKNRELLMGNNFVNITDAQQNRLINLHHDFMNCNCTEKPFCDCLEKNISEHILERRLQGWTPSEISKEFKRDYNIIIYSGDIFKYLDESVRLIESVQCIADSLEIADVIKNCEMLIKKIEG